MLVPLRRLGSSISREFMLPAKLIRPVALVRLLTLTDFKSVFSVMSKSPTVLREIPLRVVRPVLVIATLPASEIPVSKLSFWSLGSADQLMLPTLLREPKLRV